MNTLLTVLTLCLAMTSLPAHARTFPNAQPKQSIRNTQRDEMWKKADRRMTIPGAVKKFSDLDKVRLEEDFRLGYSFERPENWDYTTYVSPARPNFLLITFRSPNDALHPGTANISISRLRVDQNYTAAQHMDRSIKVFTEQLSAPKPIATKVGTHDALAGTYTAASGETGKLVVIPRTDDGFAYALLYRGNTKASYDLNEKVFEHVLKTFKILESKSTTRRGR